MQIKPHLAQGKYKGGSSGVDSDGFLHIATNLLDVPAEILALLYEYRWTIEIFEFSAIRVDGILNATRCRGSISLPTVA